jgi:hypothetical protein
VGRDSCRDADDLGQKGSGIFCERGLDTDFSDLPVRQPSRGKTLRRYRIYVGKMFQIRKFTAGIGKINWKCANLSHF